MQILFLLIPLSLVLVIAAVFAFRWAVKNRQFDDMTSPGMMPLLDDTPEEIAAKALAAKALAAKEEAAEEHDAMQNGRMP